MARNAKLIKLITPIIIFTAAILLPIQAKAINYSDFKPGRIIDDVVFTNKSSMNVDQIQAFLSAKVPICDTQHSPYTGGSGTVYYAPFTCLKDYQENILTGENNYGKYSADNSTPIPVSGGKTAAQIIWQVAQEYSINPQVLIVLLQKEQGLITDTWPILPQYTKATGYLCPDTAPCSSAASGFYKQVAGAGWQLRNDFNGIGTPGFWSPFTKGVNNILYSPNAACGTRSVNIETQATAVLYKYTPYTPNDAAIIAAPGTEVPCGAYGNRNFWRMFNDWFGDTIRNLVQNSSQAVYLIENGKKRLISTPEIFLSNGFRWEDIRVFSDNEINAYPVGETIGYNVNYRNGQLVTAQSDIVYLIQGGVKRVFPTGIEFLSNGYKFTDIVKVSATELSYIPSGANMAYNVNYRNGQLVTSEPEIVYYIENGLKRVIPNLQVLLNYGYSISNIIGISNYEMQMIPTGLQLPPK